MLLTFLDCFSNSSCAALWCLCTRAPGLPYIEELVCWSKAKHESNQIYLFSLTLTFAFWASSGDLPCKQLPVELKSQSSAAGIINSLLSLCWTQRVTYLTHLLPCFKIVLKIASVWCEDVQKPLKQILLLQLLLKSVFPPHKKKKKAVLACYLPAELVPDGV